MSGQWAGLRAAALAGLTPAGRVWFHAVRWMVLLAVALVTTLVFPATGSFSIPSYVEGATADRAVVAPVAVEFWERVGRIQDADTRRPTVVPDSVRHAIHAGDLVVARGEVVTHEESLALQALGDRLDRETPTAAFLHEVVGPALLNVAILAVFWLLLLFYRWETYSSLRQMAFFGLLFGGAVSASAALAAFLPGRPEFLPAAFLGVLVTLLYNGRLGLFAAATFAILLGGQWALRDDQTLVFVLLGGTAAALGTRAARRRREVYLTILTVIGAYALAAVSVGLLRGWPLAAMGWSLGRGAVSAVAGSALAMLLLPAAEAATRITTDVTLLELSDPGQPLLRRLAMEAPGTWAHSLAMANLCEPACEAIAAKGLLARVGCYYHDIGKVGQPGFFVENQRPGVNPHDEIKPEESASIVRNHVLGGIRLAEEAGLPEPIKAFIPEHHGTMLIEYFFDRARRTGLEVNAEDFRYPGPRPRSAETAVVMLADATEAALRLLGDPTPERVRNAVEFLIKQKVDAGQLRDCPLTLSDLDRVKEEFVRVISSTHHKRVEYPGEVGGVGGAMSRVKA